MFYKISEDIVRETEFDIEAIEHLDEYLARPNRKRFDLFSVESHTGLGSRAKPLLDEYIKRGAVAGPAPRYLCPIHDIDLKPADKRTGKCVDCEASYELEDCIKEMIYERIKPPDKLPVPAGPTQIVHSATTHQSTIRQRLFDSLGQHTVFIIRGVIVALLAAWLIPRVLSPSTQLSTPASSIRSPTPTVTSSPSPLGSGTTKSVPLQDSPVALASPQTPIARTKTSLTPLPTK